jgi:glycosyltransferase involved in cell wall biosynthesis
LSKKNILLLINQLHGGGAQKVVANLSIYLCEQYNVTLALYNDTDNVVFQYNGELVKLELPYAEDTHNNPFHKRILRSLSLIRQVRALKKKKNIDVTISFMEASNFINVLSRRSDKIIISVRSYLSHEFADMPRLRVFKTFIKFLYNRADHIIVPAELLKTDLVNNFHVRGNKVKVIYNFTDFDLVENLKKEVMPSHHEKIFSGSPVIINIGRINFPKAQWLQPKVLTLVKKAIPGTKLIILGDGNLKDKVYESALIEGLRIYDESADGRRNADDEFDLYLLGFTRNPYPYLAKSDIFLKSSVYEGFPNVIIEAMSCGLPIVSSDCDAGPREILSPATSILTKATKAEYAEYGVLTPVAGTNGVSDEDYANITAAAVIEILTNKEKYKHYSAQSVKRAGEFGVKKIITEWVQIIEGK